MTTSVNIGGGDDEFNRYKMPPVMGKVEGRGNGIKTRIVNCFEVARALHRPPGYVCKFFGCELGAQTRIDDSAGVYIVNGAFQQNVLMDVLKKFIDMFVLCSNCSLPETDLKLRKNGNITQVCNACGFESMCDMAHKLCTYIANNPPDGKKKKSGGKKDKATRRAEKAKKANGDAVEDVEGREKKKPKGDKKKKEDDDNGMGMADDFQFDVAAEDDAVNGDDDGIVWSVDTSKEAEAERMRELGAAASILERKTAEDDRDLAMKLRAYIDDGKKPAKVLAKSEKIFGAESAIHGIMKAAVLDESLATIPGSVQTRAIPVLQLIGKPMIGAAQESFLEWFDWVGAHDANRLSVLPHVLKVAWECDVVEENVIFKWYRNENGRGDVRGVLKELVEWLEEDDDDDDDNDDDNDDDDDDSEE